MDRIKLLLLCFCIFASDVSIDFRLPYGQGYNAHTYTSEQVSSGVHTDMETYWMTKGLALRDHISFDPYVSMRYGGQIKEWFHFTIGFKGNQNEWPDRIMIRAILGVSAIHLLCCVLYYFCLSVWWHAYRMLSYIHNKDGKKSLQVSL